MKNKKLLFAILIVIVSLLNACSASDSPSTAVKKAFAAAEKGDWDKFHEYTVLAINDIFDDSHFSYSTPENIMVGFYLPMRD